MSNDTSIEGGKCFKVIAESAPPLFQNGKIVLQTYHIGWIISGFFTLVAVIVSFWLISKHLQWYTNKQEQRYIVRLLFMVPLYALISFASFLFWNHSTPIILIRDAYEAIVLTAFFYLLLMYLSHDAEEQKRIFLRAGLSVEADNIARKKGQDVAKWVFPLGFVRWKPRDGLYFLQLMKWSVLQYCVIRPTSTLAAVILNYLGLYCEDSWGVGWGHIYITIVMSVSVTIAMYCLLQLYVPVANDLRRHQPLLKLFSVKAVVFLTFWQATLLSLLSMFGLVKDTKYMTADDINNAIGAILETFEMMLFAFLHIRAFTYKPYSQPSDTNPYPSRTPQWRSLGHAMDFRETFQEIWVGCVYMFDSMRGKEPTQDFGIIREVHYGSAFGRQRAFHTSPQQQHPERMIRANDITFPAVQIEVDREVEVVINGKREWLLLEKLEEKQGNSASEKNEGLQEQINRELARRGYAHLSQTDITNGDSIRKADHDSPQQRSWWRSIYDRISQSGREPEEDEREPFKQKQRTPSHLRSQRRHHRTSTQHLSSLDRDISDQSLQGILHPFKPRPSHMPLYHEDEEDLPEDDARLPLSDDDLRRANHSQYEDRPILIPGPSKPHASKRNSRSSRSGATLQFERSPSPVSVGGASGANGPMSRLRSQLTHETMLVPSLPAPQTTSPRSSPTGPALQTLTDATRKPESRNPVQSTNFTFAWSPPPVPPKDMLENISPKDTTSRQHRRSSHRRETADVTRDRRDRRTNARIHSTRPRYSGSPLDEERMVPSIDQRQHSTNARSINDLR